MGSKLAVQMFTIRDFTKTAAELAESLKKVADIGYPAVQMSAVGCMNGDTPEVSAADAKAMLDEYGLTCIATHRPWPNLTERLDEEIEFHKTLGCDFAAIGGIPGDYERSYDGYRRWLDDARPVIAGLKAEGIRFGHHNHSHEFVRPERGGPTLEDILIDEGGEDLMMEIDLYWIAHAGLNPERIVERCAGRLPVIHLKDKEILENDGNNSTIAPIGEGTMDWEHIIPTCEKNGVDWYAIEQDTCQRDPFDCLQSSYDYLTGMGL
ncbi:MAG: sugar phosphate isomerase/epimerase family protein [Planctomycetota bacterium]|jgi:sugar phosphate isomerase/epimerase